MARICFLCNGKVSSNPFRAYSKNDLKDDERIIPEGISDKDKVCSRCFFHNKDIRKISGLEYPQNEGEESHYTKKPTSSGIWILPILLGFVGGLIMYFIIMNDDKPKAQNGLVLGIVLTIIIGMIYFIFFAAVIAL